MKELNHFETILISGGGAKEFFYSAGHYAQVGAQYAGHYAKVGFNLTNHLLLDTAGGILAGGITSYYFPFLDRRYDDLDIINTIICGAAAYIGFNLTDYAQRQL